MLSNFPQSQNTREKQFSGHGAGEWANQEAIMREGTLRVDYPGGSPGRGRVWLRLGRGSLNKFIYCTFTSLASGQNTVNGSLFPASVGQVLLCAPHHSILTSVVDLATKSCSLGLDHHLN